MPTRLQVPITRSTTLPPLRQPAPPVPARRRRLRSDGTAPGPACRAGREVTCSPGGGSSAATRAGRRSRPFSPCGAASARLRPVAGAAHARPAARAAPTPPSRRIAAPPAAAHSACPRRRPRSLPGHRLVSAYGGLRAAGARVECASGACPEPGAALARTDAPQLLPRSRAHARGARPGWRALVLPLLSRADPGQPCACARPTVTALPLPALAGAETRPAS